MCPAHVKEAVTIPGSWSGHGCLEHLRRTPGTVSSTPPPLRLVPAGLAHQMCILLWRHPPPPAPEYILQTSLSLSGQKKVTSDHQDSHSSGACGDLECVYLAVCWVCCYQGSKCCLCPIVGLLRQKSLGVTLQESGGVVLSRHRALQAFKTNPSAP